MKKQAKLGARETQILAQAALGLTDKEIAIKLKLSVATVRTYWDRIRDKLSAHNRAHAVIIAFEKAHTPIVSEDIYRFLVASSLKHAIFVLDTDGCTVTWNPGVCEVFGYGKEEFIGMYLRQLIAPVATARSVAVEEMKEAMISGSCTEQGQHIRKDGSLFQGHGVLSRILDDDENLVGFAKIVATASAR